MAKSSYRLVVIFLTIIITIMMIPSVYGASVGHTSTNEMENHYLKGESISQTNGPAHECLLTNNTNNTNNFVNSRAGYYNHNYSKASSVEYSVNFTEVGLPESVTWYINLSNDQRMSSNTTYLETSLANGSYCFFVGTSSTSYAADGGVFLVKGAAKIIKITFFSVYNVIFTEVGVRLNGTSLGWAWTISLLEGTQGLTFGLDIQFHLPNGTYEYKATSTNRSYYPEQPTGKFTVNGKSISRDIVFNLVTYNVFFTEAGLPHGTPWCLSFNDTRSNVSSTSIGFLVPNGTYRYSISTSPNYTSAYSAGQITVNGSSLYKNITFSKVVLHRSANLSMVIEEIILPVVAIASIITFILIRRRK